MSRKESKSEKPGYYLRVDHKNWKTKTENIAEIKTIIEHVKGQEYLYLWAKDGDNSKTDKLKNYLDYHNIRHLKFYQGAIIKHLMRNDFLKWKINLFNETYAQPYAREEKESEKLTYDNQETSEQEKNNY